VVRTEAQQALAFHPGLADAHAMLGIVAASYDYDWEEAERRFLMAVSRDPVPSNAHSWYAYYCLLPTGRTREAVAHATRGLAADPLNMSAHVFCGTCLNGDGRLAEAQTEARQALAIEENQMYACTVIAFSYALQEKWAEAREAAERAFPRGTLIKGMLAGILRRMGEEARAAEVIQDLMSGQSYDAPLGLGWYYGIAGEPNKSAEWFGKAAERRHPDAAHHAFLVLRTISKWPALAKLMHVPENPSA
jgi:tetratricopeptide (TPR) repeat protein